MNKWTDYFMIVEEYVDDGDIGSHYKYDLTEINTKRVVATYKDLKYATKQAKYKFKKIQKRVEDILLK